MILTSILRAGMGGVLTVVDGCLGFSADDLIVFPPGARLSAQDGLPTVTVDGVTLHVGDTFDSDTRGSGTPEPLDELGDLADQAPETCRHHRAVPMEDFSRPSRP